ncbi:MULTISPECIES: hypothetical protein [Methylobacterium]|jgi:hypothetical protein|uniref:hypothetical protein n=1 Tax=Methylobacterium TaxID=407 RepID=UPI000AF9CC7F|nr:MULTISPECIES: hypothetical protein [Methylobacterium]MCI9882180.1 hypothetical protein [Methylobacterium goesingense]
MLPQLAAAGATNIVLIADERMMGIALSDGSILPRQLGRDYVSCGPSQHSGVFHSKIVVQLGREGGRAFLGSANVTASGIGGNLEIVSEISCGIEASSEQEFVRSVWRYLEDVTAGGDSTVRDAMRWARDRAPWLSGPPPGTIQSLEDGSLIAFLGRPGPSGIADAFVEFVDAPVERLVVMSPYFDDDFEALRDLSERLESSMTVVIIDSGGHGLTHDHPVFPGLELIDASEWSKGKGRFKHAKLIIAQTADYDHVLAGSANCTVPALGRTGFDGSNSEASVYRRVPRDEALAALDLQEFLQGSRIQLADLQPVKRLPPIELDTAKTAYAGRFEADRNELKWTPPGRSWSGRLVLLDVGAIEIGEVRIAEMEAVGAIRTARVDALEEIHFLRIEDGDASSTIAPLMHRGILRGKRREAAHRNVALAASSFVDRNDLQLFLVQALDELQRADVEDVTSTAGKGRNRSNDNEEKDGPSEVLPYDRFVEQKPGARRPQGGESTIAGLHSDGVRTLLNRLSGSQPAPENNATTNDDWMDLDDEDQERTLTVDVAEAKLTDRPPPDRAAFVKAVRIYENSMAGGPNARQVLGVDVLRLRFWLLLLLHAARRPSYDLGLPCTIEDWGWPRLTVRILSTFFFPKDAPIARLVLEGGFLDMPVDFLEAWTTALWCLDAVTDALEPTRGNKDLVSKLPLLRRTIIQRLGLTKVEYEGPVASRVRNGLELEFGVLKQMRR